MNRWLPFAWLVSAGCVSAVGDEACEDTLTASSGAHYTGALGPVVDGQVTITTSDGSIAVPMGQVSAMERCTDAVAFAPPEELERARAAPLETSSFDSASKLHPLKVQFEVNGLGTAVRLHKPIRHGRIEGAGVRLSAAGALLWYSGTAYPVASVSAQSYVTFFPSAPTRLEAHTGPSVILGSYSGPGWLSGVALLTGGDSPIGTRFGLTGGVHLLSPYYVVFEPSAGLVVRFQ